LALNTNFRAIADSIQTLEAGGGSTITTVSGTVAAGGTLTVTHPSDPSYNRRPFARLDPGSPPPNDSTCLRLFAFDEGTGTTADDSAVGGGYNATLYGGVTWVAGDVGPYALLFDGSTGYTSGADTGLPSGTAVRTICCWVQMTASATPGSDAIICAYGSPAVGEVFALYVNAAGYVIAFGGYAADVVSGISVNDGVWRHVLATYDGTTVNLYVNGVFTSSGTPSLNTTLSGALTVGTLIVGSPALFFPGTVEDFRIYNRVLTLGEIEALAGISVVAPIACGGPADNLGMKVVFTSATQTDFVNNTGATASVVVGVQT
jgi:hypothetical protein